MARALLVNITGGPDLSLREVHEAARLIQEAAQGEGDTADMNLGAVIDEQLEGSLRLTRRWTAGSAESSEEAEASSPAAAFQEELPTYDENDLDIPAFLRRH